VKDIIFYPQAKLILRALKVILLAQTARTILIVNNGNLPAMHLKEPLFAITRTMYSGVLAVATRSTV
jgi:hypothetical protein